MRGAQKEPRPERSAQAPDGTSKGRDLLPAFAGLGVGGGNVSADAAKRSNT
jgi:hypothetical protein